MPVPSVESELHRRTLEWHRGAPRLCRVRSVGVVIVLKISKLSLQVCGCPEQCPVKEFAPDRADQPLHERAGEPLTRRADGICDAPAPDGTRGAWTGERDGDLTDAPWTEEE